MNELDVRVLVITFDNDFMATAYINETEMPWPLLLDSDQSLYHAYGMTRGGWWAIYRLPSIWKYLKLMARGRKPGKPGKDWRQLGGDVLIDPQGIVRFQHVSTGPHDRPPIESLLEAVEPT